MTGPAVAGCTVRRSGKALALTGTLFLMTACSSARLSVDHEPGFDFARLHVWDWAPQSGDLQTPAAIKTSERIRLDSLVRRRVEGVLSRKGYVRDRNSADFQVGWSFGEWQFQRSASSGRTYGAVGLYYPGLHASGSHQGTDGRPLPPSADPYSTRFEEAKLDVVIVEAKTRRVIWHGTLTDKHDFGHYTAAQTDEVGAAVETILDAFPPTP